jgi:hypothetical protein
MVCLLIVHCGRIVSIIIVVCLSVIVSTCSSARFSCGITHGASIYVHVAALHKYNVAEYRGKVVVELRICDLQYPRMQKKSPTHSASCVLYER